VKKKNKSIFVTYIGKKKLKNGQMLPFFFRSAAKNVTERK